MADVPQLAVLNTALAALGNEPVTDINDEAIEGSMALYKLLRQVDLSRDVVLRRHGWLCALEYATLSPQPEPPPADPAPDCDAPPCGPAGNWKYPHLYPLPGDNLRVWEIAGVRFFDNELACWAPRWQVATADTDIGSRGYVRARDLAPFLHIAYVRRCRWEALTPDLVDAIGWELAGRCCYAINGDRAAAQTIMKAAENKILMAISVEGTEEGGQEPLAPSIPAAIRNMSR